MKKFLLVGVLVSLSCSAWSMTPLRRGKGSGSSPLRPVGRYCDDLSRETSFDLLEFLKVYSDRLRYHGALESFKKCGTDRYDILSKKLTTVTSDTSYYGYYLYADRPGVWTKQTTIDGRAGDSIQNVQVLYHYERNGEAFIIIYACDCDGKYPLAFSLLTTSEDYVPYLDNIYSSANPILKPEDQISYCANLNIPKRPKSRKVAPRYDRSRGGVPRRYARPPPRG